MDFLGKGVYSLTEAALLTRLRASRVREWFRGGTGNRIFRPVFRSDYPTIGGEPSISFLDLIEVSIVGQLRGLRVPLQAIRKVYCHLEGLYGSHPFCTREIAVSGTDRKRIFTLGLDDDERRVVIEALSGQHYFEKIIGPFLERIDYDEATKLARRWHIAERVVIDPAICFGKPIISEIGITTRSLAASYYANGQSLNAVAEWFEIAEGHVRAAVDFEATLAA